MLVFPQLSALIRTGDNTPLTFGTSSATQAIVLLDNGNVGIDATSPTAKLQVGTNSSSPVSDNSVIARMGGSSSGGRVFPLSLANTAGAAVGNDSSLSFIVASNYSATSIISAVLRNTSTAATDLVFTNYNTALVERMRIQFDGNVGIGVTGPAAKLHIVDTAVSPALGTLRVKSTGGNSSICIDSNATSDVPYLTFAQAGTGRFEFGVVPTTSDLYINNTVQVGATNAAVYIKKSDGNVGIGTTSVDRKLKVIGEIAA